MNCGSFFLYFGKASSAIYQLKITDSSNLVESTDLDIQRPKDKRWSDTMNRSSLNNNSPGAVQTFIWISLTTEISTA